MTPTVRRAGHAQFSTCSGQWITRQVSLIGIDEKTQSQVSDFSQLPAASGEPQADELRAARRRLRHARPPGGAERRRASAMEVAGWKYRRVQAKFAADQRELKPRRSRRSKPAAIRDVHEPDRRTSRRRAAKPLQQPGNAANRSSRRTAEPQDQFDPAKQQHTGVVLGIALASFRDHDGSERFLVLPGDDVKLTFPTAGTPPQGRQRQLHRRRFLRKQDERIRRQLRVRADPQAARAARHDRSDDRHRQRQRRSRSSSSRAPTATQVRDKLQAALPAASCTAFRPGATSRARCWPPCRWKPPSSTCCCS